MSLSPTYDVFVQSEQIWRKANSFFERDSAVSVAMSLGSDPRYKSTKVVKEFYDESKKIFVTRTVYRSQVERQPQSDPKAEAGEQAYARLAENRRQYRKSQAQRTAVKKRLKARKQDSLKFFASMVMRTLVIAGIAGGSLLYLLSHS
ncbi:hypothetical protein ACTL6U_18090 [Rhodovibrionaceae bacterium A322]